MRAISLDAGEDAGAVRWRTLRATGGFVVQTSTEKCFASHRILINGQVPAVVHTVGERTVLSRRRRRAGQIAVPRYQLGARAA